MDIRDGLVLLTLAVHGCTPSSGVGGLCDQNLDCDPESAMYCVSGTCENVPDFSGGVLDTEAWSVPDGYGAPAEPEEIGAEIGSFCDVEAYQNGPSWEHVERWDGAYGLEFQCTELAFRWVCEHYGLCERKEGLYGNAGQWFANEADNPVLASLVPYDNGGSIAPQPGDLIVFGGTPGHVAVVTEVDMEAGALAVLEQNCHSCAHAHVLTMRDGTFRVAGALGWMRASEEAGCGCAANDGVSVTWPGRGDLLNQGTSYLILWRRSGESARMQLDVYRDGAFVAQLAANDPDDGQLEFTPQDTSEFAPGCGYEVRISRKDGCGSARSEPFCIGPAR